jgi:hypothetical protein
VAGVVTVLVGEADGEGDDVTVPEFELFAGSQAAANSVIRIVRSSVARIDWVFGLLISLPRLNKIEEREDDCSNGGLPAMGVPTGLSPESHPLLN